MAGWVTAAALAGVVVVSAALNLWNIGFPLGYHIDEVHKVRFVLEGTQDFKHPLLILQLIRAANVVFGYTTSQDVAVLGRSVLALCGALVPLFTYLLARQLLARGWALIAALAVGVAPTLVLHAHYIKEDTVLTTCLLASLVALVRFANSPNASRAVLLGIAAGFTFSAHYKSLLLVPVILAALALGQPGAVTPGGARRSWRRAFLLMAPVAALVAAAVFMLINWAIVSDPHDFWEGVTFEAEHAVTGHDIRVRGIDTWFTFHLRHSLAPGMGWPALILGLGGLVWVLWHWRQTPWLLRLLAVFTAVFYLIPEVSPLKPAPDYSRYVMPAVPALILLGCWLLARAVVHAGARRVAPFVACGVLILYPAIITFRLIEPMDEDTRGRAVAWAERPPGQFVAERYTGLPTRIESAAEFSIDELRADGTQFVVLSSLMYDRFFVLAPLSPQDADTYVLRDRYRDLFRYPYVEIQPQYRPFGFTNPVIRIVDIRVPRQ